MDSILQAPKRACPETLLTGRAAQRVASLVICDPAVLCAQALEAVVLKHTSWHVACVTTSIDVALVAAGACKARALLFDVRDCAPRAVSELVLRARSVSPETALILLTGHTGGRFLRSAIAAGVGVCVHKSDLVASFCEALQAVQDGVGYRSATIASALAAARGRARYELAPMLAGLSSSGRRRFDDPGRAQSI